VNIQEWIDQGHQLAKTTEGNTWAVADWLLAGERVGADSKYKDAAKILHFSVGTCRNYASCARKFPPDDRNKILRFGFHLVAMRLPPEQAQKALEWAACNGKTASQLRAEIRARAKAQGAPDPTKTTVDKKTGELKPAEPRFILDGLNEPMRAYLVAFAFKKGVTIAAYVLDLLNAHVQQVNDTPPEVVAQRMERSQAENIARLQRIPLLKDEVIIADDWKKRTLERAKRIIFVGKAKNLDEFFDLFAKIYGAALLPARWLLNTAVEIKKDDRHGGWAVKSHPLRFYGENACKDYLALEVADDHILSDEASNAAVSLLHDEQLALSYKRKAIIPEVVPVVSEDRVRLIRETAAANRLAIKADKYAASAKRRKDIVESEEITPLRNSPADPTPDLTEAIA
jgi:hypothetical protein